MLEYRALVPEYDAAVAAIIRANLKAHHLDIPGTAYFDDTLDRLSHFYSLTGRVYYVLVRNCNIIGGIGLAEFVDLPHCCELQKLYLDDVAKGHGFGYQMIHFIEERAWEYGYRRIYLETHTNLQAAIHIYMKSGYTEIHRPASVIHSAMNRFFLKELYDAGAT